VWQTALCEYLITSPAIPCQGVEGPFRGRRRGTRCGL